MAKGRGMDTTRVMRATLTDIRDMVDHFLDLRKGKTPEDVWAEGGFNVVRAHCEKLAYDVISDPYGIVLFTEHAIMAGQVQAYPFNRSVKIANEVIFQSDGQDGPLVLRAFEEWARDMGATVVMTSIELPAEKEATVAKAMGRFGYQVVETTWRKWLV